MIEVDLIAVGEVLLDVTVSELVPGRITHGPAYVRAGGVPVNAALAAARVGARAAVVGRVGSDPAAVAVRATLAEAGVEAILAADDELPTGTYVDSGHGEARAIAADRGASACLAPADIPAPLAARSVLVSGHALLHDDTAPAALAALAAADAPLVAVVAAAAGRITALGAEVFHLRARGANVLLANEAEAAALTGLAPAEAAVVLGERYELAVITAGAEGAVAVRGGEVFVARPVEPLRAGLAGAGDAFAGALLVSLARGAEPAEALDAACEAASLALSGGPTMV